MTRGFGISGTGIIAAIHVGATARLPQARHAVQVLKRMLDDLSIGWQ